jgi:cell division protein ZapA
MDNKGKNRIAVSIMGEEYILRGSSSPDEMDRVGRYVDRLMRKLCENNIQMSRHRIAVLAALNLADELLKLKADHDRSATDQIKEEE